MRFRCGATTDVGRERETNEDSFLVDDRLVLFAVADGMGGHSAGEIASFTALEALRANIASSKSLEEAIRTANKAVYDKAHQKPEWSGMGTTITAFAVTPDGRPVIGHVGDSRAYLLRDSELSQLTEDHSLVEELVREGRITEEQAEVHPQRAIITRALGIESDIEIDIYTTQLRTGDRILICSDGLTSMIRPEQTSRILQLEDDPGHAAESLVDAANDAGGEDNITAVVIDVLDGAAEVEPSEVEPPVQKATPVPVQTRSRTRPGFAKRWTRRFFVILPIIVILGVGIGAVGWYARNRYFVDFDSQGRVTVYKGVPGGLLSWDPTVESPTKLTEDDLTNSERLAVEKQPTFDSKSQADEYINNLKKRALARREPTTTTISTTTTTTTTTAAPAPVP